MGFREEYLVWLRDEQRDRTGLGAGRLMDGLGHAEMMFVEHVWWPVFGHFRDLHAEYEVYDFKDTHRFIDFAYIRPTFRVAVEIDGMETHVRDVTQQEFIDHLQRQNDLVIDDWRVIRFAYEQVRQQPRSCQKTLTQLIAHLSSEVEDGMVGLPLIDRVVLRNARIQGGTVTAEALRAQMNVPARTLSRHLKHLEELGWVERVSGTERGRVYRVKSRR
ncbi:helix-turn-helix domain-containing protein [Alicyclobacillus sp. ALC3]|uniref:helix-turn-helix domain-containing protein n=1 Tax=Alicyclobacillus sp. ALC3 TaxID=2796143 RepID=UPI0023793543|nr:MarR family transcriptional regulator [Alicyclobacillus sp. ALC3]WDL98058.1 MarR family transcriptional regulator [Alicyclobacillus sp. ALC3]